MIRHHHRLRAVVHRGTRHDLLHGACAHGSRLPLALHRNAIWPTAHYEVYTPVTRCGRHDDRPASASDPSHVVLELDTRHGLVPRGRMFAVTGCADASQ